MFHTAELLDAAVAAMVVGHQKTFGRNNLTRASAAELDDGILERGIVDAVNLFRSKPAPELFHRICVELFQQWKHPHSFVCPEGSGKYRNCGEYA